MQIRLQATAVFLMIAAVAAPATGEVMVHAGIERAYRLHVPAGHTAGEAAPLVLVLHGRSSDSERMMRLTGFNERADRHGFIVVYPDGLDGAWNYVHGIPGYRQGPDDPAFLLALADRVSRRFAVDPQRIYVAGISNGGFMAQRLACVAPGRVAAVASVAAGGFAAMPESCDTNWPVSVLYIHGTADTKVPWQGLGVEDAAGNRQLVTMGITNSLEFWSRRNGCSREVSARTLPRKGQSPGTSVQFLTAVDCEAGSEVSLYAVTGGGHNWPGSRGIIPPAIAGRVTMDIHASDVIGAFFLRHSNTPPAD